jgi:glycolate oxidase FAD binding subunit
MGLPAQLPAPVLLSLLEDLRHFCTTAGGHCAVLRAPAALKAEVDVWGPVPGIELMRRIKDNFDPAGRLAPGRFVGGI